MLRLAAQELSHDVRTVMGWEEIPERAEGAYLDSPPRHAGDGVRLPDVLATRVMRPLGDDGFRTVADATTTTFSAETEKGVLNAVYTFLGNYFRLTRMEPVPLGEISAAGGASVVAARRLRRYRPSRSAGCTSPRTPSGRPPRGGMSAAISNGWGATA